MEEGAPMDPTLLPATILGSSFCSRNAFTTPCSPEVRLIKPPGSVHAAALSWAQHTHAPT